MDFRKTPKKREGTADIYKLGQQGSRRLRQQSLAREKFVIQFATIITFFILYKLGEGFLFNF